jgi:hypothetical protein
VLDYLILEPLTIEELVAQDSSVEGSFCLHKEIWWRKIKPFFYQPAFFFQPIKPKSSSPSFCKALIGYHHVVPDTSDSNSYFRMLIHKNVKEYSLDMLSRGIKSNVKKAYRHLRIKKVIDVNDLLTDGYGTYVSFRKRTNWGHDKSDYQIFSKWIWKAFKLKKRIFLGVYLDDRLICYSHPYVVEGIASLPILISHSEYLEYRPNDLLVHTFLTICKNSPDVTKAQFGPASLKPSLDTFKIKYGFEIVKYPTYAWLNPFVKPLLKNYYRKKYKQLFGL